jgi:hypothetical protein
MGSVEALLDDLGYEVAGKFTLFREKIAARYLEVGGYGRFRVPCIGNRLSSSDPTILAEILSAILNRQVTPQQFVEHQHQGSLGVVPTPAIPSKLHEMPISRPPFYWEITSLRFTRGERPAEIAITGGTFPARFDRLSQQQRSGFALTIRDGSVIFQGVSDLARLATIVAAAYGVEDSLSIARILNVGTLFDPPQQSCQSQRKTRAYEPQKHFSTRQRGRARRSRWEWRPDEDGDSRLGNL